MIIEKTSDLNDNSIVKQKSRKLNNKKHKHKHKSKANKNKTENINATENDKNIN